MPSYQPSADVDQPASRISHRDLLIAIWTLVGFAVISFAARAYIRLKQHRRFLVDDYFALLGLVILVANAIVATRMLPAMFLLILVSVGYDSVEDPAFLNSFPYYMKLQFAFTVLFWSCLWSVKACFLSFFYRFTDRLKGPRRVWWAIAVFTGLAYVGSVITYPIACSSYKLGGCNAPLSVRRSLISLQFSTIVDVITDLSIMGLPFYIIMKVKISAQQKIGLFLVISLGLIIIAFSIVRVILTNKDGIHPEASWLTLWSAIESSVSVMVACLASFGAMLAKRVNSAERTAPRRNLQPRVPIGATPIVTRPDAENSQDTKAIELHEQKERKHSDRSEEDDDDLTFTDWLKSERMQDLRSEANGQSEYEKHIRRV